jgi:hypothetical protein
MSDEKWQNINDGYRRLWKKAVVAYFKLLSRRFPAVGVESNISRMTNKRDKESKYLFIFGRVSS